MLGTCVGDAQVWSEGRKADQALCSGTELEPGRVSQLAEAKAKAETVFTPNAKQLFAAIQQALAQGADELSAGAVAGVPVPRPTPGTAAAIARPAPPNSPATERQARPLSHQFGCLLRSRKR